MNKCGQYKGIRYRPDGEILQYPFVTIRGCQFPCTYCCNTDASLEEEESGRNLARDLKLFKAQLG